MEDVCANVSGYTSNLTSAYTNQSNEATIVASTVIMFVVTVVFFNFNLFSRLSDVSAILNPKVGLALTAALGLFVNVMTYLFSEAKNADKGPSGPAGAAAMGADSNALSLRARLILTWMLIVELLRKKVEVIRMEGPWYSSGNIDRALRVVWLGNLVFFTVKGAGRQAVFSIIWILCAAKLVQKMAFTEVGKRSYAFGKNGRLITDYMERILQQPKDITADGQKLLKMCKYAVKGEEKLVNKEKLDYHLSLKEITNVDVVDVGKIWERNDQPLADPRLKRLCLSFALFKLLRRRFEHLPAMTEEETSNCRDLIFKGLCKEIDDSQEKEGQVSTELFQVINDELNFLNEYYNSVLPVVLASPFFFLVNYIFFPIVVFCLCLMTVILCGNGDLNYAFRSIKEDNIVISIGVIKMAKCLLRRLSQPSSFFSTIDLTITVFLFLIFFYEEVWEFIVFVLSNWFTVSLLCGYIARCDGRALSGQRPSSNWSQKCIHLALRCILWLRKCIREPVRFFKQLSVLRQTQLWFSLTPAMLSKVPVPAKAQSSIMKHLVVHVNSHKPFITISNVMDALERRHLQFDQHSRDSIAEVILIWHIATSLLEEKYPHQKGAELCWQRKVASALSKYCAYLVAFHAELLPVDREGADRVYRSVQKELKDKVGFLAYHLSPLGARYKETTASHKSVLQKGVELGKTLIDEAEHNAGQVWKVLADVWVELIVYVAPSNEEECVMGHAKALVQGGEFLTHLWALTTHTGIAREPGKRATHAV